MSARTNLLGQMVATHRRAKGLTQKEVAERVGMARENYSQLETGRRKEPLTPIQAAAISALLDIPMLALVNAMGYAVKCPGLPSDDEMEFLDRFRKLTPAQQIVLRAAVGLEPPIGPASS